MNRPCTCGSTPELTEDQKLVFGQIIYTMRLICGCEKKGAVLMYTKPEDRARMQEAAWDGWNLAGGQ